MIRLKKLLEESRYNININHVERIQKKLIDLKHDLKYGADGKLGPETLQAIANELDVDLPKDSDNKVKINNNDVKIKKNRTDNSATNNIIIGDSQTPYIFRKLSNFAMPDELQEGGKGVGWLRDQVAAYPVSSNINNVVLCIGTNGSYKGGAAETDLFASLRDTFPNAKIYAVQGSWGWGNHKKRGIKENQVRTYYKDHYQNNGAILIEPPIGNQSEVHGQLPVYSKIAANITQSI